MHGYGLCPPKDWEMVEAEGMGNPNGGSLFTEEMNVIYTLAPQTAGNLTVTK